MTNEKNPDEFSKLVDRRIDVCKRDILEELTTLNETLAKAFPHDSDGKPDIRGHRQYHENLITAARAQEKFWEELRLDIAKKGAWGLLIILIGLLIIGIQVKLGMSTWPVSKP